MTHQHLPLQCKPNIICSLAIPCKIPSTSCVLRVLTHSLRWNGSATEAPTIMQWRLCMWQVLKRKGYTDMTNELVVAFSGTYWWAGLYERENLELFKQSRVAVCSSWKYRELFEISVHYVIFCFEERSNAKDFWYQIDVKIKSQITIINFQIPKYPLIPDTYHS